MVLMFSSAENNLIRSYKKQYCYITCTVCACVFEDPCTFLPDHNQLYIPVVQNKPS